MIFAAKTKSLLKAGLGIAVKKCEGHVKGL